MPLQRAKNRPSEEPRDIVFVSHATPADNDFARWISFRLAREGYRVWVDLKELKGGEDWWRDIEYVIRHRAAKFIVAVSRNSNERDGVLKEIAIAGVVAKQVKNFIVPARIDDLPHAEFNIEIKRYNGPDFSAGWAPAFTQLLEMLDRDKVPRTQKAGPEFIGQRWHDAFGGANAVTVGRELLGSNWLRVDKKPEAIFWHERDGTLSFDEKRFNPVHPTVRVNNLFFSFATADELAANFAAADSRIARSSSIELREFTRSGLPGARIESTKAKDIVTYLYRTAVETYLGGRMLRYDLASGKAAFWFPPEKDGPTQRALQRPDGSIGRRALAGKAKRFTWHFALELRPTFNPWVSFSVVPHVVFAENGVVVASKRTQHSLRRRVCKQWFNDQWFDRIILALQQLGGDAKRIVIPLGGGATLESNITPELFTSPVTYTWIPPTKTVADTPSEPDLIESDDPLEDAEDGLENDIESDDEEFDNE